MARACCDARFMTYPETATMRSFAEGRIRNQKIAAGMENTRKIDPNKVISPMIGLGARNGFTAQGLSVEVLLNI